MDESKKRLVQRLIRRIPTKMLKTTLEKWGHLTGEQLRAMDSIQSKWALTESLLAICEVSRHFSDIIGSSSSVLINSVKQYIFYENAS